MLVYTLQRLGQTVFVLLGITLFVAFTVRLSGDPAVALFQGASAPTQAQLEQIRRQALPRGPGGPGGPGGPDGSDDDQSHRSSGPYL